MIEVLIAVLVFSVGLLGMVSMQLGAKRSSYEATQRSIATGLARDILERMRSNPGQLPAYVVAELGASTVTAGVNCNTTSCTPVELASRDLYEWNELLSGASEMISIGGTPSNAGGLALPRACITHNAGQVSVAITWKGVSDFTNPTESGCGNTSGLYDSPSDSAGNNLQRRLMVMTTYIGTL